MITVTCGGRRRALSERLLQSTTVDVTAVIIAAAAAPAVQSTLAATSVSALSQALGVPIISKASPFLARAYAYPAPPPTVLSVSGAAQEIEAPSSDGTVLAVGITLGLVGLLLIVIGGVLLNKFYIGKGTSTVVKAVAVDNVATTSASSGVEMEEKPESKI